MKKKLLLIILAITMLLSVVTAGAQGELVGMPSRQAVSLNGETVKIGAYNIEDENYFKLRDLAALLRTTSAKFNVFYSEYANNINIFPGEDYQPILGDLNPVGAGDQRAIPSPQSILVSMMPASIRAYNVKDNNYFRLRDLGPLLNFDVDYDAARDMVVITTDPADLLPTIENEGANGEATYTTRVIEKKESLPEEGFDLEGFFKAFEILDHDGKPFKASYDKKDSVLSIGFAKDSIGEYGVSAYVAQEGIRNEVVEIKDGTITKAAIEATSVDLSKPHIIHVIGIDKNHKAAPILELINFNF